MTHKDLCDRWMRLIQAEQRNARVFNWWTAIQRGDRTLKATRMRGINHACGRTEKIAWSKVMPNSAICS